MVTKVRKTPENENSIAVMNSCSYFDHLIGTMSFLFFFPTNSCSSFFSVFFSATTSFFFGSATGAVFSALSADAVALFASSYLCCASYCSGVSAYS